MSTIAMQSVIARLCVDINFRREFLNEPQNVLGYYDLTEIEVEGIRTLDMDAVKDYAASLVGKKTGTIRKWLPLALSYLEITHSPERAGQILRGYSLETIRDTDELGGEWVRGEFNRLCDYLGGRVASGEIESPYFVDLLAFEALTFRMELDPEASNSAAAFAEANQQTEVELTEEFRRQNAPLLGKHVSISRFNYDISELVHALEGGLPLPALVEEPTWVLFFKVPRAVKVEAHAINDPLKELLGMCAGKLSVDEIISDIVERHVAAAGSTEEELWDDCLQIMEQLYGYGAISFVPSGR